MLLVLLFTIFSIFLIRKAWQIYSYVPHKPAEVSQKRVDVTKDRWSAKKIPQDIDAIVIGSGVGGLYCAGFLAKAGKRVLVLEQHYIAGGATHTFEDHGYEFDTGLHYVNNVKVLGPLLNLVTDEEVKFAKLGNEKDNYTYDEIVVNDLKFECREKFYFKDLEAKFPGEAAGLRRIREAIDQSQTLLGLHLVAVTMPKFVQHLLHKILPAAWWRTLQLSGPEMIGEFVKDPKLQAILLARYGDIGGPPQQVPFALTVAIGEAFAQDGGAYPVGGCSAIAKGIIPTIEKRGGRVLVNAPVDNIIVENGKAVGVRVKGVDVRAKMVISGAGAWNTFTRLLPQKLVEPRIPQEMKAAGPSVTHVYAFIGLKGSQAELKLPSRNYWVVDAPDYDVAKAAKNYMDDPANAPLSFFFGFPSAKDPIYNERHPGKSVCLAFAETSWEKFEQWHESKMNKREEDYVAFKKQLGQRLVDGVLKYFPELEEKIDWVDFASPLTNRHYLNSEFGESLGIRLNMYRCSNPKVDFLRPKTQISNLFLTGQDAAIPGVFGAIVGGLLTAQVVLGPLPIVPYVRHNSFYSKLYPTIISTLRHFHKTKKEV